MSILFSFVPWIIFGIFLSFHMMEAAALGGLAFALFMIILDICKKHSMKILQLGSLIFFIIIAILVFFVNVNWFDRWLSVIASVALTLIILISVIMKKPFTLQYAKDTTTEKKKSPQFIHAHYMISYIWLLMLSINAIFLVLFTTILPVKSSVNWIFSASCFVAAILFSNIYVYYIKKKQ